MTPEEQAALQAHLRAHARPPTPIKPAPTAAVKAKMSPFTAHRCSSCTHGVHHATRDDIGNCACRCIARLEGAASSDDNDRGASAD